MPTFCSSCLVVDGTVDGKDDNEEKTRWSKSTFGANKLLHISGEGSTQKELVKCREKS